MNLASDGWSLADAGIDFDLREALRRDAFSADRAGTRCLLDLPVVRQTARHLKERMIGLGRLPSGSVAIQAIAFNKTATTNWKVAWHQDLMFPIARPATRPGYTTPAKKGGVDHACPPREVLSALLAVRLHLDPCDEGNGPLRVSPGTHLEGIIPSDHAAAIAAARGEIACLAREGEAVLMRPLLLHASSQATTPRNRRVLHVVFHDGSPVAEPWHRAI
jgi:hypothetical protein